MHERRMALAFAITGAVTFSAGFQEPAGFPKPSMSTVRRVMGASRGGACIARALQERRTVPS